jgi:hypothetical protein
MPRLLALVAAVLFPVAALAAPITVHNTGVDSTDALVAPGGEADFWTLLSAPAGATEAVGSSTYRFNCCYVADSLDSAWVAPAPSGNASVNGIYVYELLVDLTGFDLSSVNITGMFSTDNDGFIRVNDGASAATTGFADFGSLHAFTLNAGFIAGMNSIQVGVNNGGNPTAFRVEFSDATGRLTDATVVPEPASLLLFGSGIAGVIARRRRQRSHSA